MCKVLNESASSYYYWLKEPVGNVSTRTKNYPFISAKFMKKIEGATVAHVLQRNCRQKVSGYRAHG